MSELNILLIPAGAATVISSIKALRQDKYIRIISADIDKLAPGLYLSDKGYIVPPYDDKNFFPKIKEIVKKENIQIIFPGVDRILLNFSKRKKEFEEIGTIVMVSDPQTIKVSNDKWLMYTTLKDKLPIPKSYITPDDIDIDFPLFIKPRHGTSSHNTHTLNSQDELNFFYKRTDSPLIQEYLGGKEYDVDCMTDKNGNLIFTIPREDIEQKSGTYVKTKVIYDRDIIDIARRLTQELKFYGLFNFSLKRDAEDNLKLVEINPRIGGSMHLSSISEPNIHLLACRLYTDEKIERPKIRYGLYTSCYLQDIFLTDRIINETIVKI